MKKTLRRQKDYAFTPMNGLIWINSQSMKPATNMHVKLFDNTTPALRIVYPFEWHFSFPSLLLYLLGNLSINGFDSSYGISRICSYPDIFYLEPISKLKVLRLDEARAFFKAQFTRSK
jgi:hypothetical protein